MKYRKKLQQFYEMHLARRQQEKGNEDTQTVKAETQRPE